MDRKYTKEELDILIAQRSAVINKANYCIENLDRTAAVVEIYVGDDDPVSIYMTREELSGFLNKEICFQKSCMEHYQKSPVFA